MCIKFAEVWLVSTLFVPTLVHIMLGYHYFFLHILRYIQMHKL